MRLFSKKGFEVCRLKILHIEIVSTFLKLPIRFYNEEHLKKKKNSLKFPYFHIEFIQLIANKKSKNLSLDMQIRTKVMGEGVLSAYTVKNP